MPDTAALNIINLNIDSIQVEIATCKTNREEEMQAMAEGCTNTDTGEINKQDANGQNDPSISNNSNNSVNYFFSSSTIMANKKQSSEMTQKIHNRFGNVFNGIGCFEGTICIRAEAKQQTIPGTTRHVAYVATKPLQGRTGALAEDGHHNPTRGR